MADNDDRGAFIWYELMTTDADGASAFYKSVVGWDIAAQPSGDSDMDYRMITRSDGGFAGGVLNLTREMCDNGARAGWLGYIHVPDVDAAIATLGKAGGSVQMPPVDMEGVGRMAMVADPQGAVFYLMAPSPPPDDPDAKSDVFDYEKAQHFRWNELWTTDQDAAVSLYTGLFGWTQEGAMPMGAMGDYLFIQQNGGGIGAIGKAQPGGEGSRWQYFVGVDDIDRACKAVTDSGGQLLGEPQQIPGGEYSVYAHDPQGASIGLVGPRK
ncbi:VOC family protein [Porphyrobacter algicida]|uniref:VOC family protein n=1 Tax=Qipengyuania algicida TaxID=1836209 RepID=A0A845AJI5_9SPHN|nr:VOC family protein [Qipengyuania algicida]MXP27248.1 VOC family protein [Qipengyuania algicida]